MPADHTSPHKMLSERISDASTLADHLSSPPPDSNLVVRRSNAPGKKETMIVTNAATGMPEIWEILKTTTDSKALSAWYKKVTGEPGRAKKPVPKLILPMTPEEKASRRLYDLALQKALTVHSARRIHQKAAVTRKSGSIRLTKGLAAPP
ncbi:hypothetical protein WOLCODRAFT_158784 [Wolfiporia cocos MD-104 SS10]|uniref:Uncharacterized protein n=1 Tax=Wolfiporia cocos (strain MD-104) TaxID=742152 RepID=A0A2H3JAK7_WOLCO|nr:hypothetical protein WOLCODRAFT_158784 [Wolfiporia cocos MD-104 SS10]